MNELRLALLGRPLVTYGHTPLTGWTLQKTLALLAYLAVTGQPHSREELAGLLWPACTEANARGNLRKVLAELHRRLPSHVLTTRAEVAFDRLSPYWLDVQVFERAINRILARGDGLSPADAAALAEAVELYRGRFLLGLSVHHVPDFEAWVLIEQEHLSRLALRALQALADYHAAREQPASALDYLKRLLAMEPAQEEAQRLKMWLLAAGGQRSAALHQYLACCQALHALDAEPDDKTVALYERIRTGAELPALPRLIPPSRPPSRHLPTPLLPLVGRQVELSELRAHLHDPTCRLLTLIGPAGCGKTRLALEGAAEMSTTSMPSAASLFSPNMSGLREGPFADDVYFVPLASVSTVDALAIALAQTFDVPLSRQPPSRPALLTAVHGKRSLLVLDGFEHLLAGADLVVDLLEAAPTLKILVTSRARLDVAGEHLLTIQGLPHPEHMPANCEALASFPAVRLFVASARQIQPGFDVTGAEVLDVARVCHHVGGLPLAILLAANWIGVLTPAEIAAELGAGGSRGLDLLQRDDRMLPARQRSMRAVYDRSWELLSAREQQVLANLSVFGGGFAADDARQVAGASLHELRALMSWSLLRREAGGRYAMDKLLCQYAAEKLAN